MLSPFERAVVCHGQIVKEVLVWYCFGFSLHVRYSNIGNSCEPEIIMKSMDHPNIIKLYETFASWQKHIWKIMEVTDCDFCEIL